MADNFVLQETLADALARSGNTKGAIKIYVFLIKKYVEQGDFFKAENLRDRIVQTDGMAIAEIVYTAEVIDKAKSMAITPEIRSVWSKLNEYFSDSEVDALYYSMYEKKYNAYEYIYRQGDKNDALFFISSGLVNSSFKRNSEDFLLQSFGPGSIAGHDSFFFISLCTSSLVTAAPTKINILTNDAVSKMKDNHAGILPKLKSYCMGLKKPSMMLNYMMLARREHVRFRAKGKVLFSVITSEGKCISNELRGELSDISLGGLSFYIRTANEDQARTLLDRRLMMRFGIPTDNGEGNAEKTGRIRGVIARMFHDYSLHIKFDELLDNEFEIFIKRYEDQIQQEELYLELSSETPSIRK